MVIYAPHTLFVKRKEVIRDEFNRTQEVEANWVELGPCRCDDNTTASLKDATGNVYVPKYKVVASRCNVKAGDVIKVLSSGEVRGEGKVAQVIKTNYLDYLTIYV